MSHIDLDAGLCDSKPAPSVSSNSRDLHAYINYDKLLLLSILASNCVDNRLLYMSVNCHSKYSLTLSEARSKHAYTDVAYRYRCRMLTVHIHNNTTDISFLCDTLCIYTIHFDRANSMRSATEMNK